MSNEAKKGLYGVVCVVCSQCGAEGPRVSMRFNAGDSCLLVDRAMSEATAAGWKCAVVFTTQTNCHSEWECPAHRTN